MGLSASHPCKEIFFAQNDDLQHTTATDTLTDEFCVSRISHDINRSNKTSACYGIYPMGETGMSKANYTLGASSQRDLCVDFLTETREIGDDDFISGNTDDDMWAPKTTIVNVVIYRLCFVRAVGFGHVIGKGTTATAALKDGIKIPRGYLVIRISYPVFPSWCGQLWYAPASDVRYTTAQCTVENIALPDREFEISKRHRDVYRRLPSDTRVTMMDGSFKFLIDLNGGIQQRINYIFRAD